MDEPLWQFIIFWLKIAAVSTLVGAGLSAFDMSANEILERIGLPQERLIELLDQGFQWALPNLILGSMIILPLWFLACVIRPPRG